MCVCVSIELYLISLVIQYNKFILSLPVDICQLYELIHTIRAYLSMNEATLIRYVSLHSADTVI
jgi:hypothetical protein